MCYTATVLFVLLGALSVHGEAHESPKVSDIVEPSIAKNGLLSLDKSKCLSSNLYKNEKSLLKIKSEGDYLCAFYAFQANKVSEHPCRTTADADLRYGLFKKCVDEVNKSNSNPTNTYKLGVNAFCDMTEEDKKEKLGLQHPKEEGMLLGSRRQ